MPNIIGCDISTKTGIVVLSEDCKFFFATELENKKISGLVRLSWFRDSFSKLIKTYNPTVAVIENYGFSNAFTLATLVEIGTIIRMVCYDAGIPIVLIPPNSLKSFITGGKKGNAGKDVIMLEVYKRWGFEAATNNIADAYGLAKIGQYLYGYETVTKDISTKIEKIESVKDFRALSK